MKAHLKTNRVDVVKIVDDKTGEILNEEVVFNKYLADSDDEFYLVFTSLMNIWEQWNLSVSDLNMFAYLCSKYANGAEFSITQNIKDQVAIKTGKSITTFNNTTRNLIKQGLLVKVGHKSYKLNPRHIYQGSSKNRKRALFEILNICPNC